MSEKVMDAGVNEAFVCRACSKVFYDRDATRPFPFRMRDVVVQEVKMVPHARYPDDRELDTVELVNVAGQNVIIPPADAGACCPTNTMLCDTRFVRFRKNAEGVVEIVGVSALE